MKTMHLFAGIGGGLLADKILGHEPIISVEWDGYCCQVLRERAADGWFPGLRVWEGDVRMFDPSEYAGKVDCIHAGFPCQDISVAGNQAGVGTETRSGLYREVIRIAGIVRPRFLFLENVAAILGNGLGTVLADLAAMGMDARWLCIRASDVGAPHHRDRWFCLAYARHAGICERREYSDAGRYVRFSGGNERNGISGGKKEESDVLADTECFGQQGQRKYVRPINSTEDSNREADRAINGCQGNANWWDAESDVGGMVDEFPSWFHENMMTNTISRCKITASLMECCHEKKTGRAEVLRVLRNGDVTKEIQQASGRLFSVYETALLLSKLCEYKSEPDKARIFMESAETLKNELRGMWLRKEATSASHRPEPEEQRTGEHSDAMQALPRLLAHDSKTYAQGGSGENAKLGWWDLESDVGRVANGIPHRIHRLKGLGNAQVPLQAAVAWKLLGGE